MVYTVGETVLDVIIQDFDDVKIRVGGSMLNTAISLGRLGVPIEHISYVSDDFIADSIFEFLVENNVSVKRMSRIYNLKTNLAMAFLDEEKKANYVFYKNKETEGIVFKLPEIEKGDIILFGSFFSLNLDFREQLIPFLQKAKDRGAIIIYDPNFRVAHLDSLSGVLPFIEENIKLATLIKGSDEDFKLIFNATSETTSWEVVKSLGAESLVYTKGANGAVFINDNHVCDVASLAIDPLSTIGAGDTFTAGIIYHLCKHKKVLLDEKGIVEMLDCSHLFSAQVCKTYDNYLANDFIKKLGNVQ